MAHYLEAWSDVRSLDGTATIVQPLIEPLYDGKSAHELLSVLLDETPRKGYDVVKETLEGRAPGRGRLRGLLAEVAPRRLRRPAPRSAPKAARGPPSPRSRRPSRRRAAARPSALEAVFRPDPSLLDGRFANNGWLQELPKPLSKLTWDNAAVVSPATAQRLGLQSEDVVTAHGEREERRAARS